MSQSYTYDEGSQTWPFFALTISVAVAVPLGAMELFKTSPSKQESNPILEKYTATEIKQYRNKQKRGTFFTKRRIALILSVVASLYLIFSIYSGDHSVNQAQNFDPYDLLGVALSATEKEIKSAYRKLSIKYHPDKIARDISDADRLALEERYVLITKAYKALTDEETRENFLKYGHPDGLQSTTHGIALPAWLVEGTTSTLLLMALYFVLICVVLPYFVRKWWTHSQSYTKQGLHTDTASLFCMELINFRPSTVATPELILKWVSRATELQGLPKAEDVYKKYLDRQLLTVDEYAVVAKSYKILLGLQEIACGFRNTEISVAVMDTMKVLAQCTKNTKHANIAQLPNVNAQVLNNSIGIRTIAQLLKNDDKQVAKILGIKDDALLKDTLAVAKSIPQIKLVKAEFVVPGESCVTPSSLPHVVVKVLIHSAAQKLPAQPPHVEPESLDLENAANPYEVVEKQPLVPRAFTPFFPIETKTGWVSILALAKDNKVMEPAHYHQHVSFENLTKSDDADWLVGTFKIPLTQPAPPQTGNFECRVVLKNVTYFGCDLDFPVVMKVVDPPSEKIEEVDDEEEDDDEEEEDVESDFTDIDTDTDDEE